MKHTQMLYSIFLTPQMDIIELFQMKQNDTKRQR